MFWVWNFIFSGSMFEVLGLVCWVQGSGFGLLSFEF